MTDTARTEPFVLVSDDGPVRTFTLDEPARRNPLSVPLRRELRPRWRPRTPTTGAAPW
jgi:enoyl-CoA hydratase/carnithine racemase